jgi:hypothetical protein
VNKIMFGGFLFSSIYILQEYIGNIRQCSANRDSRGKNLSLHPITSLFFKNFKICIFESQNFLPNNTQLDIM